MTSFQSVEINITANHMVFLMKGDVFKIFKATFLVKLVFAPLSDLSFRCYGAFEMETKEKIKKMADAVRF